MSRPHSVDSSVPLAASAAAAAFIANSTALFSRWQGCRLSLRTEGLALLAALFFALVCNRGFWAAALAGYDPGALATWKLALALFVLLAAGHCLLLLLLLTRWTARPTLTLFILATAFAVYFTETFGVYLDPGMLRNALRTDVHEASELLTWGMLPWLLLYAGLPLLFLSRVRIRPVSLKKTLLGRGLAILLALLAAGAALLFAYQDLASLMRNQKTMRYLVTPGNWVYSLVRVSSADARAAERPRLAVGKDAALAPAAQSRRKPVLFVIVVGETARAANWGLSGYARQTTPELSRLDVINFSRVTACGTNTEVSLPCMFSAIGRRDYDEERIRGSESLLHVLDHAGLKVLWRDNQSGCKGVCDGLEEHRLSSAGVPGLCDGERCLDDILLHGLDRIVADAAGNLVLVLHQLGNHGPAYFKRYPPGFRRFLPACEHADLARCSVEEVVNAYDNALLYTDALLARTVSFLRASEQRFDTAMLYVSDHGESLGENKLFLHGVPYAIAPDVQTGVPMVMWLSSGFSASLGLDPDCLRARAAQPLAHDHLFHSVLGLLQVNTAVYQAGYDFSAACRPSGSRG